MKRVGPGKSLSTLIGLVMIGSMVQAAWDYQILHEFERPGTQPLVPLVLHGDGNFYGTTVSGGVQGLGAIFQLSPGGALTTLASFSGADGDVPGAAPIAGLVEGPNGALYGTTSSGGANGFGGAFKITTTGTYTQLLDFTGTSGAAKGSVPGALVLHPDGNFYGTTQAGGANGHGTVFSMTPAGALITLLEFTGTAGAAKGSRPRGTFAISGNTLNGVTEEGGTSNAGTIYKITTAGAWTNMADLTVTNGANPPGGVLLHSDGALYGLTEFGGSFDFGTAFKLTTATSPVLTVLHHFDDPTGSQPVGGLAQGGDNALYGATSAGGVGSWGTVFRLTTAGAYSILANFSGEAGATPGSTPRSGLILGSGGDLFGTTSAGGPGNLGVVCKITTTGTYTPLANCSLPLGWTPSGAPVADGLGGVLFPTAEGGDNGGGTLLQWTSGGGLTVADALGGTLGDAPDGALVAVGTDFFGVTSAGTASGRGAAFTYDPINGASLLHSFTTSLGSLAEGPLTEGTDGALYGVSREGGTSARGTIYQLTTAGARTRLISFSGLAGTTPGRSPRAPLALAANGDFYGLTEQGGADNLGVLFRITHAGSYTLLDEFTATGPRSPLGGLLAASDGFLYGTTSNGGPDDAGTLLLVSPGTDSWSAIADFPTSCGTPVADLAAADGALWGLCSTGGPNDLGGVFTYLPGSGLETIASFSGTSGATPGSAAVNPGSGVTFTGGLLPQADRTVLGLAAGGGTKGGGVLFRLTELTPLRQWKLAMLGDLHAPDLGDPDGDGLVNLLEYTLGLIPTTPDAQGALQGVINTYPEGQRLALVIPRDPPHPDLTVVVESSPDLQDPWTPLATSTADTPFAGPGYVGGDSPTPGLKSVEIRDLLNLSTNPHRFLRIRVTY